MAVMARLFAGLDLTAQIPHTAIHSPHATVGFTALTAFTLALTENHPYLFAGGKSMVFFVLKGQHRFLLRENRVGCEKG